MSFLRGSRLLRVETPWITDNLTDNLPLLPVYAVIYRSCALHQDGLRAAVSGVAALQAALKTELRGLNGAHQKREIRGPGGEDGQNCRFFGQDTDMSWEQLADDVRLRRKQLKLTQADVAERGGLSVMTVRNLENNRAGRLTRRLRRALERALEWPEGRVDAVVDAGRASSAIAITDATARAGTADTARAAAERFAIAERLVKMRQAFLEHRDHMSEAARAAMEHEFSAASRETEEALIWMLPWLADEERSEAIRILARLQDVPS